MTALPPPPLPPPLLLLLLLLLLPLCRVLLVALGLRTAEYLAYDDLDNYERLPFIDALSFHNLHWVVARGEVLGVYEPAALVVKMLYRSILGRGVEACLAVSLGVHSLNTALVYHSLRDLTACGHRTHASSSSSSAGWTICSAAAALVYGAHPHRVEVLCWPSCQPYLLATMWSLLSIMAHHRALRATNSDDMQRKAAASPSAVGTGHWRWRWRCVSVLCYAAAALSKAAAIPVVTLLLALDALHWIRTATPASAVRHGPGWLLAPIGASLRRNVAAVGVSLLAARLALSATPGSQAKQWSEMESAPYWVLLRAATAPWLVLGQFLHPSGLTLRRRAHPDVMQMDNPCCLAALLGTTVVCVGGFWCLLHRLAYSTETLTASSTTERAQRLRQDRINTAELLLLLLAYAAFISPTLVVQHGDPMLSADRYTALPDALLTPIVVARLLQRILIWTQQHPSVPSAAMIGLMILWLSSLGLRTYQYSLVWANREELWRHAAAVDPRDSVPYNQLGLAIERAGRHNESRPRFTTRQGPAA